MKLLGSLVGLFVACVVCQNATQQEELARALALLQTMPECSRTCLLEAVAAAGISGANLDIASSCSNTTATAGIEHCARSSCTIREQLTSKNITEALCQRPVRESPTFSIASIIGGALAIVCYTMRMLSKISFPCERGARIDADLWWDDLTISFAMLLVIPISILSNILTGLGVGKDVWTIPFEDLTEILRFYYADEIMYLAALPIIKIAILCTYLRIFQQKAFRQFVYGALALNVAYAITFILITVFQCTPVSLAWHHWDSEHPGRCNNINAQSWASAGVNIFLDVVVVGLPMPLLWKMQLNARKKVLVMLMFGVGFFVTFVSVLRLRLLVKFGESQNLTYDYKKVGYWTVIELDTALCCACMPGIRNLIRKAFPKLMGQSKGYSSRAVTPGLSGFSGQTAVNSGLEKSKGAEAFVRPRHSDDDHFIPLQNVSSQNGHDAEETYSTHETASGTIHPPPHVRNFSHPNSSPTSAWRPVSPAY